MDIELTNQAGRAIVSFESKEKDSIKIIEQIKGSTHSIRATSQKIGNYLPSLSIEIQSSTYSAYDLKASLHKFTSVKPQEDVLFHSFPLDHFSYLLVDVQGYGPAFSTSVCAESILSFDFLSGEQDSLQVLDKTSLGTGYPNELYMLPVGVQSPARLFYYVESQVDSANRPNNYCLLDGNVIACAQNGEALRVEALLDFRNLDFPVPSRMLYWEESTLKWYGIECNEKQEYRLFVSEDASVMKDILTNKCSFQKFKHLGLVVNTSTRRILGGKEIELSYDLGGLELTGGDYLLNVASYIEGTILHIYNPVWISLGSQPAPKHERKPEPEKHMKHEKANSQNIKEKAQERTDPQGEEDKQYKEYYPYFLSLLRVYFAIKQHLLIYIALAIFCFIAIISILVYKHLKRDRLQYGYIESESVNSSEPEFERVNVNEY